MNERDVLQFKGGLAAGHAVRDVVRRCCCLRQLPVVPFPFLPPVIPGSSSLQNTRILKGDIEQVDRFPGGQEAMHEGREDGAVQPTGEQHRKTRDLFFFLLCYLIVWRWIRDGLDADAHCFGQDGQCVLQARGECVSEYGQAGDGVVYGQRVFGGYFLGDAQVLQIRESVYLARDGCMTYLLRAEAIHAQLAQVVHLQLLLSIIAV